MSDQQHIRTVRECLKRLKKLPRMSNDDAEVVADDVNAKLEALPVDSELFAKIDEQLLQKSDTATAAQVYAALSHVPEAESRFAQLLQDESADVRNIAIDTIASRRFTSLAPALNPIIMKDPDEDCQQRAIFPCSKLVSPTNLETLIALARKDARTEQSYRRQLLIGLRPYRSRDAVPYFQSILNDEREDIPFNSHKEHRVYAAWGLMSVSKSYRRALRFLVVMLDDPLREVEWEGGGGRDPGVSNRAAQALSDLYSLKYDWGRTRPPRLKQQLVAAGIIDAASWQVAAQ